MTWTRISDGFTSRPDVAGLSDAAFRAHVEAMVWSNQHTTDGRISNAPRVLAQIAPDLAAIDELVAAHLWEPTEGGWQLDWSEQETAERVAERREEWRRRDERRRLHIKGDHSTCDPKRCHYLLAHPDALTRETTGETRGETTGDSRPPAPVPLPSRPLGREGEREGAGARSAGAPRSPRPEGKRKTRGFTFSMPERAEGSK